MKSLKRNSKPLSGAAIWLIFIFAAVQMSYARPVKVACVGNSITYGFLVPEREKKAYPSRLQGMLGDGYEVRNFGKSGATLLEKGHRPYVAQQEYRDALAFCPDIVVIHLGVNDTDPRNWPNYKDEFEGDYLRLITSFRNVNPDVRVILARLSPLNAKHKRFKSGTRDWRIEIQGAIERVAKESGAELIDFDEPLRDRQNLLPDGIHPDAKGAELIAKTVYGGITGDYGGLQMPEIYTNGMVLQRDRYLKIRGRADAGASVRLSIAGQDYRASADNRGDWSVVIRPLLASGNPYEMTVSDGGKTLRFEDILAGEVWLASGQSNMEFPLRSATGAERDIADACDSNLRFYDMKPIKYTENVRWEDSALDSIDALHYYKKCKWEQATPKTASGFSAVAYYFGKMLRDSLDVPVGIISNAIGGSSIESWIDVNALEADLPEILLDWRKNDYVQPWAQGRAAKNTGTEKPHRHPYEPGYLFATGIRPLCHYPIAGVIWYQGESNAHNIEVHEHLFPLFVDSWRNYFEDKDMPVYFAQLSSLSRPSWPQFRDSQRRMAIAGRNMGMAVTSDVGDSLDVHPRNKKPVGQRLARLALHGAYGMAHVVPSGPVAVSAVSEKGAIFVNMEYGEGMHASDGGSIRSFEVAETDGIYFPAEAEVIGNKIKIYNMTVKKPRFVRYGWQPFTRANLVNASGLPASTFKLEVENAADFEPEEGIEVGVSACYAGLVSDCLVMVGGCNFPERPMASDSKKRFYRGIYAAKADGAELVWKKVGVLPEAAAYGASVSVADGMVLIGGTTETESSDKVYLLSLVDGVAKLDSLPSLPFKMDNMYACAIGRKVYVAGGNKEGQPCREALELDLGNLSEGWVGLPSFPGNPRVQPVMASGKDKNGESCLFLWGGFAGKGKDRQATLEVSGLKYTPSKNKWSVLDAPADSNGVPVSVGGGAGCALSDGTIVVTGGVNKDVFLEALRNQAPDYLQHDIEWYKFNKHLFVFNPRTLTWKDLGENKATARAGAAIVAVPDNSFYLIGGELKPRIRTADVFKVDIDSVIKE